MNSGLAGRWDRNRTCTLRVEKAGRCPGSSCDVNSPLNPRILSTNRPKTSSCYVINFVVGLTCVRTWGGTSKAIGCPNVVWMPFLGNGLHYRRLACLHHNDYGELLARCRRQPSLAHPGFASLPHNARCRDSAARCAQTSSQMVGPSFLFKQAPPVFGISKEEFTVQINDIQAFLIANANAPLDPDRYHQ